MTLGYTGQALFLPNWFVRRRGLAMSLTLSGVGGGFDRPLAVAPDRDRALRLALGLRRDGDPCSGRPLAAQLPSEGTARDLGLEPDGDRAPQNGTVLTRKSNVIDPIWAAQDWTLRLAVQTTRFWWIAAGYFFGMIAWYSVQVHQTKYLVEVGFTAGAAAWALGFVSLVAIPGQIALGHLSDRIGREWVWTVGCVGFAVCYTALLLLGHVPRTALLWLMVVSQGMLGYGLTSVIAAIPAEIFEGRELSTIIGALMLAATLGGRWGLGSLAPFTI